MSDLMRIPFGQRESDGVLVDVHDTPNGRRCGWIHRYYARNLRSQCGMKFATNVSTAKDSGRGLLLAATSAPAVASTYTLEN